MVAEVNDDNLKNQEDSLLLLVKELGIPRSAILQRLVDMSQFLDLKKVDGEEIAAQYLCTLTEQLKIYGAKVVWEKK